MKATNEHSSYLRSRFRNEIASNWTDEQIEDMPELYNEKYIQWLEFENEADLYDIGHLNDKLEAILGTINKLTL